MISFEEKFVTVFMGMLLHSITESELLGFVEKVSIEKDNKNTQKECAKYILSVIYYDKTKESVVITFLTKHIKYNEKVIDSIAEYIGIDYNLFEDLSNIKVELSEILNDLETQILHDVGTCIDLTFDEFKDKFQFISGEKNEIFITTIESYYNYSSSKEHHDNSYQDILYDKEDDKVGWYENLGL